MKARLLSVILSICVLANVQAQIDISAARAMALTDTVTVSGIVTNGAELGVIRYMQDLTGAIAVYDGALSGVNRGDSITVTGVLSEFNNLLEMDAASHTVLSTGNTLPAPLLITPSGMGESVEAQLVQIDNLVFDNGGATFSGNTNYGFTSGGETGQLRVTGGTGIEGTLIPLSAVSVVALQSQFSATYQLLPRDLNDITQTAVLFLTSSLDISAITTTSVDLSWITNASSNTNVKYGLTTALELGEVNDAASVSSHTISVTGLTATTFYYAQAYSVSGTDTAFSNVIMISTESNSSGVVRVVFNNTVDNSVATVSPAVGPGTVQDTIISLIQKAKSTIDVCVYNCNNVNIVNALNTAYAKGVVVRYVSTISTANLALSDLDPGIDVMKGNSDGIMHNKFVVVDRDDVNNSWVLSGSTNWTTNNLLYDYNNVILIQDQAIAKAFTIEFEEMWGGSGTSSNFLLAKFGSAKKDNTPHYFRVGGNNMEVFFSPTDQTTSAIVDYIGTTDSTLEFAILSFTRDDIGLAVADAYNNVAAGVRGVMESIGDQGEEFTWLAGTVGVDLLSHQGVQYDIHHKYAVIDANAPTSDPLVLTGSHNWSTAAETKNDENTVIIHDAEVANHFHQEFNRRHCELDTALCVTPAQTPVAVFSLTNDGVGNVTFTDMSFNTPTSWSWDFGDGSTSTDQNPPVHSYPAVDSVYAVCLTVTNGVGSNTWCVNVPFKTPIAFYSVNSIGGGDATFTDLSSNAPTGWAWDFGDAGTSTEQNPSYTYAVTDSTYSICLTATNYVGSNTYCSNVFIQDSLVGINPAITKVEDLLKVYPNPSNGSFYLNFMMVEDHSVMIRALDTQGKIVYQELIKGNRGENTVTVSPELSSGFYIIELNKGGSSTFTSLVIE